MQLDDDPTRLQHIIEAALEAMEYVNDTERTDFEPSRQLQHSVVRCIEVVGEAANRLSKPLRDANPQIPWAAIIGMRNRIVHAYFDIDIEIIWKTAMEDFPELLTEIKAIKRNL